MSEKEYAKSCIDTLPDDAVRLVIELIEHYERRARFEIMNSSAIAQFKGCLQDFA